jgi:hypothetical protein
MRSGLGLYVPMGQGLCKITMIKSESPKNKNLRHWDQKFHHPSTARQSIQPLPGLRLGNLFLGPQPQNSK